MTMTDIPPAPPKPPRTPKEVRGFQLPMDQLERIKEAGGPLAEVDTSNMHRASIAAVEVDGKLVAYWPVWRAIHAEPLWVSEEWRHSPAVIRALLRELETALDPLMAETGEHIAFAIIGDADILRSGRYAMRLGFERVPGDLFFLIRQPAADAPVKG
jgi:hypothetical protein